MKDRFLATIEIRILRIFDKRGIATFEIIRDIFILVPDEHLSEVIRALIMSGFLRQEGPYISRTDSGKAVLMENEIEGELR